MGVSPEEGPGSAQAAKRPRPDAVTFNAAAAACAKAGDYQKAEQVLKQARRFNKLDAILYTSVISACGRAGVLFGLSQHATVCIEDVAAAAPGTHRWFQSYLLKDRAATLDLVRTVEIALSEPTKPPMSRSALTDSSVLAIVCSDTV